MNWLKEIPWKRIVVVVVTGIASYILVPVILARYNEVKSLRDARLTRAIKFGDRNDEFNGKINASTTLLRMFSAHNHRRKISGAQLEEQRKELYEKYRERYLELDATVWWWPSDFVREASALRLLTPNEMTELQSDAIEYNKSVSATMNQMISYWQFLDSPDYRVDDDTKKKSDEMETKIASEFQTQHAIREDLVKKISTIFEGSKFRTGWWDLVGL